MSDHIIEAIEDAIGHLLVVPEFADEWQRLRARLTPYRERVASAIEAGYRAWINGDTADHDEWRVMADAAIDAARGG